MYGESYRIINSHGVVDYAVDRKVAEVKYRRYVVDMIKGYSDFVKLVVVIPGSLEEIIIACASK